MNEINHYEANSEFRFLYSQISDHFIQLEAFLKHIHDFVNQTEKKIGPGLKYYSSDFFEYYYAASYGETFRSSFIITVCSISEFYLKYFIITWGEILDKDLLNYKPINSILDYLKIIDKEVININTDFSREEIFDLKCLLAVRNAMVHSHGTFEFVNKYKELILRLAKKYSSLKVLANSSIMTEENFCDESINISKRFFYYIFKLSIRKFPNYISDRPNDEI
ncbi:hypothetical protein ACE01N_20015 [Saccharicrinis sp. FJH2]|uniref:hypothetical protein n=1 Tax=Saccharicrinis sp. FJH65 TaxID=3344659 RepID=UPI0035F4560A